MRYLRNRAGVLGTATLITVVVIAGWTTAPALDAQARSALRTEIARPRVAPLPAAQWSDAQRALVAIYGRNGSAGNELATVLHHPDLAGSVMAVVKYFAEASTLSPRHRETLILRTAWLCGSEYIWAHHAAVARQLNFDDAGLRRLAEGPSAPGLDPFEATLLLAADELYRNSSLSDTTWNALSARLDQHQMMDAVFTIPAFTMLAIVDNSLDVQLEAGLNDRLPDVPRRVTVPSREPPLTVARIPPLEPSDWTPAIRAMLDPTGAGRNVIAVYRTFARHPALYAPRQLLSEHIRLQNTLAARERELLILRMGWIGRSEYEWQQHARTGRAAGLDTGRVAVGADAPGWDVLDRALLQAADEMYRDDRITDATWAALTPLLDTKQLLDALVTAGGYRMVSTVLNAFGVQLESGDERFPAASR